MLVVTPLPVQASIQVEASILSFRPIFTHILLRQDFAVFAHLDFLWIDWQLQPQRSGSLHAGVEVARVRVLLDQKLLQVLCLLVLKLFESGLGLPTPQC